MPLYEEHKGGLSALERLRPGPELYEKEVEALIWSDLEAFTGEALFPIACQPRIAGGGIPDILALDTKGHVVVIEVKRDIDRNQLAQILEYAGWARMTSLDEIAKLYRATDDHQGEQAFFRDWQDFTDTTFPKTIQSPPRLFLIAGDFESRTHSALNYLREHGLPVIVVPVTLYRDHGNGRRIIDIGLDHEPRVTRIPRSEDTSSLPDSHQGKPPKLRYESNGKNVTLQDLLAAGLLVPSETLDLPRPRKGTLHHAIVLESGRIRLEDGSEFDSPSRAARVVTGAISYDGWTAWGVRRLGGARLHDLRERYLSKQDEDAEL